MNKFRGIGIGLMLFIAAGLLFPPSSYAYLDPSSGSYILQIIVVGLVAISVTIKTWWRTIKAFLAGLFSKKKPR